MSSLFLIDLEELYLNDCSLISDVTVQNYLKLPYLRILDLNDCKVSIFLSTNTTCKTVFNSPIGERNSVLLISLIISFFQKLTVNSFTHLSRECSSLPSLQTLNVNSITVTNEMLMSTIPLFRRLRAFYIQVSWIY